MSMALESLPLASFGLGSMMTEPNLYGLPAMWPGGLTICSSPYLLNEGFFSTLMLMSSSFRGHCAVLYHSVINSSMSITHYLTSVAGQNGEQQDTLGLQ